MQMRKRKYSNRIMAKAVSRGVNEFNRKRKTSNIKNEYSKYYVNEKPTSEESMGEKPIYEGSISKALCVVFFIVAGLAVKFCVVVLKMSTPRIPLIFIGCLVLLFVRWKKL